MLQRFPNNFHYFIYSSIILHNQSTFIKTKTFILIHYYKLNYKLYSDSISFSSNVSYLDSFQDTKLNLGNSPLWKFNLCSYLQVLHADHGVKRCCISSNGLFPCLLRKDDLGPLSIKWHHVPYTVFPRQKKQQLILLDNL
jgi:hypothetical protein